ncbi:MAG: beta-propeller fold lactonase family protein, partial [Pirellulales bacterium]|nr:beta-propeller fold lactonase family protein [Pirellulales bacterium]
TITALPEQLREVPSSGSELRVHPNGRFVYAAIRGHDTIAVFSIDPDTGKLTFVEREPIRGSWPRNFNLDPSGKWLLAAGRNSNTISVFRIDPETGGLIFTGQTVNCPTPICISF